MGGRFKDLIVVSLGVVAFGAALAIYTAAMPAAAVFTTVIPQSFAR